MCWIFIIKEWFVWSKNPSNNFIHYFAIYKSVWKWFHMNKYVLGLFYFNLFAVIYYGFLPFDMTQNCAVQHIYTLKFHITAVQLHRSTAIDEPLDKMYNSLNTARLDHLSFSPHIEKSWGIWSQKYVPIASTDRGKIGKSYYYEVQSTRNCQRNSNSCCRGHYVMLTSRLRHY